MQTTPTLARLHIEDAIGQLRRREGFMAALGSEDGTLKLDWVEGVARLLADETQLEEVEEKARLPWEHGIRHLIWAGMGGSVITVQVLAAMGFCGGHDRNHIAIYPLDSTDPLALNAILQQIAHAKSLPFPTPGSVPDQAFLHTLLKDVMLMGISMGTTSEEPITHLTWFADLVEQAQLPLAEHTRVMTFPGSYLDQFGRECQMPYRPVHFDDLTGIGGRMSAPATRIFLFPVALYLARLSDKPGQLRAILQKAWQYHNLDQAANDPTKHPFVQLACALYDASIDGACCLFIDIPQGWQALIPWIEQLMEESLGKGGKGIVVFNEQSFNPQIPHSRPSDILHVRVTSEDTLQEHSFTLQLPYLASTELLDRLAALAASFLGWQLTMALYGYLHQIPFAGQPAVENYKARARALRLSPDPLQAVQNWKAVIRSEHLTLLAPPETKLDDTPATIFARALQQTTSLGAGYLDLTVNGELSTDLAETLTTHWHRIGNTLLGLPVKLRRAPAAYHSTEQSEMDGPPYLISLRILFKEHPASLIGTYTDTFLQAQAISTWQAMVEQGRPCFLLIVDGRLEQGFEPLQDFFTAVEHHLHQQGILQEAEQNI